jgi:hypothetical protein
MSYSVCVNPHHKRLSCVMKEAKSSAASVNGLSSHRRRRFAVMIVFTNGKFTQIRPLCVKRSSGVTEVFVRGAEETV